MKTPVLRFIVDGNTMFMSFPYLSSPHATVNFKITRHYWVFNFPRRSARVDGKYLMHSPAQCGQGHEYDIVYFLPGSQHLCHTGRFSFKMMATLPREQFNFE